MKESMFLGIIKGMKYNYEVILCRPNREELMYIQYSDLTYTPVFKEFNQLNITIDRLIGKINGETRINPCWGKISHDYLIHLLIKKGKDLIYQEFFIIENPELSGEETDTTTFSCSSLEKNDFNNKNLEGIKDLVRKLYDPTNARDSNGIEYGIMNYICRYKLYNTWTVGHVDESLLKLERVLNFSGQNLTNVLTTLAESCKCVFIFDNVNKKINIYESKVGMLGENRGLVIASNNYINNITYLEDTTGIKTRLFMSGKDNAVITKYNPTGQRYVDNFSYYIEHGYFTESLTNALIKYNNLIESKRGLFESYLDRLDINPNDQEARDLITQLRNDLLWENNFTQVQINELVPFIKETNKSVTQISDERQLYEYAVRHLKTICFVPIQISVGTIDVFALEQYQLDWDKLTKIGDFCNIYYEPLNLIYKEMRMISYTHNPVNNSLSLEFSNIDEYITKQWDDFVFINTVYATTSVNSYSIEGANADLSYLNSNIDYVNNNVNTVNNTVTGLTTTVISLEKRIAQLET